MGKTETEEVREEEGEGEASEDQQGLGFGEIQKEVEERDQASGEMNGLAGRLKGGE